jgi:kumamolisin
MADVIQLTLVLRQPAASKQISEQLLAGTFKPGSVSQAELSATPGDIQAVVAFAEEHSLQVVKADAAARTVRVAGSVSDIEAAFGIPAEDQEHGNVATRDYRGPLNIPAPLDQILIAVLGLDQTPIARHHGQ